MNICLVAFFIVLIYVCVVRPRIFRSDIIHFCDKSDASKMFRSEHFDYHKKFNFLESKFRTGIDDLSRAGFHEQIKIFYCNACLEFSVEERRNITNFISRYPILQETSWKFIKLPDSVDFGFPFTIGDAIAMPQWLADSFSPLSLSSKRSLFKTLIHESIHITQRFNPDIFENLYQTQMNWRKTPDLIIPSSIRETSVTNPDGYDNWIAQTPEGDFWYSLILNEAGKLSKQAYPVADAGGARKVDGQKPINIDRFKKHHENIENCYHPNEVFAYVMSERLTDMYFKA